MKDLIGENAKLDRMVQRYYQKSKGLVEMKECYERVIGPQLMERMRGVYKLGQVLRDIQDIARILKG